MGELLYQTQNQVSMITLNRADKHNALDDVLLKTLQVKLDEAIANPQVRVILLKANGRHFSAGADLNWMKRSAELSEAENVHEAMILARVMHTLHKSPKPTLAMIQGGAFGGGAGLVAACDIAIASTAARFCFSEVKLGLIPAVISPYVIKAIGERTARWLFMSAETIDAQQAMQFKLIHHCVAENQLESFTLNYVEQLAQLPPQAVSACKTLIENVAAQPINESLLEQTAILIAKVRASAEGQQGLKTFLDKK